MAAATQGSASLDDLFSFQDDVENKEEEPSSTTPTLDLPPATKRQKIPDPAQYDENDSPELSPEEEYLIKVETDGDVPLLYLLVQPRPDLYYLQATDAHKSWVGVVPHQQIAETAKNARASVNEYSSDTRKALTAGGDDFVYTSHILASDGSLELSWKKRIPHSQVLLFLGSVVMEMHPATVVARRALEYGVGTMAGLRRVIGELRRENSRLVDERGKALKRLEETVSLKEQIESDLYSKFKLVLNEKKAKIRRLMESLQYLSSKETATVTSSSSSQHQLITSEPSAVKRLDDGSNDDGQAMEETTPSPKLKQVGGEGEGSVLTDEWACQDTAPPLRKRTRGERKRGTGLSNLQRPPSISSDRSERSSRSVSSEPPPIGSQELINMM